MTGLVEKTLLRFAPLLLLLAASCGAAENQTKSATKDMNVYDVTAESAPETAGGPSDPRSNASPQIAYSYTYGYRLGAGDIAIVQRRHTALCDALGPTRCRVASLKRESGDGEFVRAELSLLVDARIARAFGERLDTAVTGAGGSATSRGIEAEDLSKDVVDTAAKIRGKEALSERLLLLLRNRTGKVGELVEAERAYAAAQEELDAARSWLAEMQGRVSMSRIDISYASSIPVGGGALRPLRDSLAESGQVFGRSLAALLTFTLILLPWALLFGAALFAVRRLRRHLGWRWPRRRRAEPDSVGAGRPD